MTLPINVRSIPALLDYLGIRVLSRNGPEWLASCPRHTKRIGREDKHPSWSINVETGLFRCWSCDYSGNVVTLLVSIGARTLRQARSEARQVVKSHPVRLESLDYVPANSRLLQRRLDRYTKPPGRLLGERHITRDAADEFEIRFDVPGHAWILPIRSMDGVLWGWERKGIRDRSVRSIYPPGVPRGQTLYGGHLLKDPLPLVVVEAPLAATRLHGMGIAAVATGGTEFTSRQVYLLEKYAEWVIAYDNDEPGRRATRKLINAFTRIRDVWIFPYPDEVTKLREMEDQTVRTSISSPLKAIEFYRRYPE